MITGACHLSACFISQHASLLGPCPKTACTWEGISTIAVVTHSLVHEVILETLQDDPEVHFKGSGAVMENVRMHKYKWWSGAMKNTILKPAKGRMGHAGSLVAINRTLDPLTSYSTSIGVTGWWS